MQATTKIATQTTATPEVKARASMFLLEVSGNRMIMVIAKLIH